MCAARTRSDEEKMARLAEYDPMPHALRHDDCLTGLDADRPITVCLLQNHVHPTGNEVEDFVSVRMNFASMGRIPPHARGPDRESSTRGGGPVAASTIAFPSRPSARKLFVKSTGAGGLFS